MKVQHDGTIHAIWEKLTKINEETLTDERVAIHHITSITLENLQKMTEAIFHRKETRVTMYTTANNRETKKERTTYGMIISIG